MASGDLMAVRVPGAVGNRWFFADRCQRIPDECVFAVAHRIRVGVQLARFVGAARDCRTRIDAIAKPVHADDANLAGPTIAVRHTHFRLTHPVRRLAPKEVVRIAGEALLADACRSMVAGHAQRVRAALEFTASVDAVANTAAKLEANF